MTKDKPTRVTLSRAKDWRMPANTLKVDRGTPWGNPFRVVDGVVTVDGTFPIIDNAMAVTLFHDLVLREGGYLGRTTRVGPIFISLAAIRRDLAGANLACWCHLGAPCHADVLLEFANQSSQTKSEDEAGAAERTTP